eukprot:365090-Chlamydomonas_euryale.AAC.7
MYKLSPPALHTLDRLHQMQQAVVGQKHHTSGFKPRVRVSGSGPSDTCRGGPPNISHPCLRLRQGPPGSFTTCWGSSMPGGGAGGGGGEPVGLGRLAFAHECAQCSG